MDKSIQEDYRQKPAEYLEQLEKIASNLSLKLGQVRNSREINVEELAAAVRQIHDLSLKAHAVFTGLYPEIQERLFEHIGSNNFRLSNKK